MRKVKSSNSSMLNVLESKQEIIRNWGLILFLRVSSNLAISHLDVYLHMRSTNYFLISPGTFIFSAIEGFWANWSKYSRRMDWSRSIPQSSHEQTGRWWINRPSINTFACPGLLSILFECLIFLTNGKVKGCVICFSRLPLISKVLVLNCLCKLLQI